MTRRPADSEGRARPLRSAGSGRTGSAGGERHERLAASVIEVVPVKRMKRATIERWWHAALLDEKWRFICALIATCFALMVLGVLCESAVLFMVGGVTPTAWAAYRAGKLLNLDARTREGGERQGDH